MKIVICLLVIGFSCLASNASSSSSSSESSSSSSESSSSESDESDKIKYTYTLWIGDDVGKKYSINMKSKSGIYFIDAMNQAAGKNGHFRFEKSIHPGYGPFITEICAVANDKAT